MKKWMKRLLITAVTMILIGGAVIVAGVFELGGKIAFENLLRGNCDFWEMVITNDGIQYDFEIGDEHWSNK